MGVVLREAAHPQHSRQFAALFIAVHRPELGVTNGQIAVGAHIAGIDHDVVRAVHRLENIRFAVLLALHQREHFAVVVGKVARLLVKAGVADVGRDDPLIAAPELLGLHEVNERVPQCCAFREPQRKTRPDFVGKDEQAEFASENAVVALFGLFQPVQVVGEFLFGGPRRAINAREHLVLFAATPVCARRVQQFEVFEQSGMLDVRPPAQVYPIALPVEGDHFPFRQVVNEGDFVGLVETFFKGPRLVTRPLFADYRVLLVAEFAHLLFDALQVAVFDWLRQIEVIVEPVFDGRADGVLNSRKEFSDGLCHQVRGGVTEVIECIVL